MGQTTPPVSVVQFKAQFARDFVYGPDVKNVRDSDIQAALNQASSVFNPSLFETVPVGVPPNQTTEAVIQYCNCAAHFLWASLQAAGGLGIVGRGPSQQGEGVVASKGVGGVSVSFTWPDMVSNSPVLHQFTRSPYGCLYLQTLMTRLVGNVATVFGEVTSQPSVPLI